ncbi:MAG: hypothetical protein QXW77_03770 [Candidatus Hadarchaeales archaeon]
MRPLRWTMLSLFGLCAALLPYFSGSPTGVLKALPPLGILLALLGLIGMIFEIWGMR